MLYCTDGLYNSVCRCCTNYSNHIQWMRFKAHTHTQWEYRFYLFAQFEHPFVNGIQQCKRKWARKWRYPVPSVYMPNSCEFYCLRFWICAEWLTHCVQGGSISLASTLESDKMNECSCDSVFMFVIQKLSLLLLLMLLLPFICIANGNESSALFYIRSDKISVLCDQSTLVAYHKIDCYDYDY